MRGLAPLAVFIVAGSLSAQAAIFSTYGTGCPGSGGGPYCYGQNQGGGTFRFQPQNAYNFALRFTPTSNTVVLGFDLYTRTQSSAVSARASISTQVFAANTSGAPVNPPLRTGTMVVGSTVGFYRTTFAPLPVTQGKTYFVAYNGNKQVYFPHILAAGTSQHFYQLGTGKWTGPFKNPYWCWRVVCVGDAAIPKISNTGLPKIGTTFSVDLSLARPNSRALFAIGATKANANMSVIGAPGCTLLTNPVTVYGLQTNASGALSVPLKVPDNQKLIGLTGYTQFAVADVVNSGGVVFSAGGQVTVGK